jgi:hypothetical protein
MPLRKENDLAETHLVKFYGKSDCEVRKGFVVCCLGCPAPDGLDSSAAVVADDFKPDWDAFESDFKLALDNSSRAIKSIGSRGGGGEAKQRKENDLAETHLVKFYGLTTSSPTGMPLRATSNWLWRSPRRTRAWPSALTPLATTAAELSSPSGAGAAAAKPNRERKTTWLRRKAFPYFTITLPIKLDKMRLSQVVFLSLFGFAAAAPWAARPVFMLHFFLATPGCHSLILAIPVFASSSRCNFVRPLGYTKDSTKLLRPFRSS